MSCEELRTLALRLAYDGAPFCGFARQEGQPTVQGSIEQALAVLFRRPIETVCAGRTDAGVHARAQVVSFNLSPEEFASRTAHSLKRSLNALVDEHISISAVQQAPTGFSARFDAVARQYHYYLYLGSSRPVLLAGRVWHLPKTPDIDAMREAAVYLLGEHDFKSFCTSASAVGRSTCREVLSIEIEPLSLLDKDDVVRISVRGNAFLHSMVRTMVGTLVAVGCGRRKPQWVEQVLQACDRRAAGETAPAQGLVFWQVDYKGPKGAIPLPADADAAFMGKQPGEEVLDG